MAGSLTIEEVQRRSALVPRSLEGRPVTGPITARHLSQAVLDEAAKLRVWVPNGVPAGSVAIDALCRVIGLSCELAKAMGVVNLTTELDARLPTS